LPLPKFILYSLKERTLLLHFLHLQFLAFYCIKSIITMQFHWLMWINGGRNRICKWRTLIVFFQGIQESLPFRSIGHFSIKWMILPLENTDRGYICLFLSEISAIFLQSEWFSHLKTLTVTILLRIHPRDQQSWIIKKEEIKVKN
jgi:hypothetical protein